MKDVLTSISIICLLTFCNKAKESGSIERISNTKFGEGVPVPEDQKERILKCSEIEFSSIQAQADSLTRYFKMAQVSKDEEKDLYDQKFFCAFPNSFEEMEALFGYDEQKGEAPLYFNGDKIIYYFSNLTTISKDEYYDKYVSINIGGNWQADNIREAFYFVDRLQNDTKAASASLSKRTDEEVKSVFYFIFDGPHPKNDTNKRVYDSLLPKVSQQDERLGKLLKEAYHDLMEEFDGHGH